jgi:probable F420-dependent oxidoreductase
MSHQEVYEMKVGLLLPNIGMAATRENILYIAKEAEAAGLDSLWVIDRLLWPQRPQTPYVATPDGSLPTEYRNVLDPFATLSYVAANTERISLGTSIADMPFYSPVILARQFASLDVLSGGRVIAGLGLGWSKDEYEASNVPFKDRGSRADEILSILKRAWTEDVVEFQGKFYRVPASRIDLKPIQKPHPPILLGGFSPNTFSRVAKYADGWIPIAGFGPLDQVGQAINGLKDQVRKSGRDPSKVKIFMLTYPNVLDSSAAKEGRLPLTGTIEEIGEDIQKIKQLGADHIMFGHVFSPVGSDMRKTIEITKELAKSAR